MRIFNYDLTTGKPVAQPTPPAEPKQPKVAKVAEKPQFAKFRIEDLDLFHEFKLAATVRKMTLIRAFSRAMRLFIDELAVDLDKQVAAQKTKVSEHA